MIWVAHPDGIQKYLLLLWKPFEGPYSHYIRVEKNGN